MAIYSIEAITNLHVGDMGTSYDIVDKVVQKDVVTGYPMIYASSLKGAVRSFAEKVLEPDKVKKIFGGEGKDISKGSTSFNDAHLLLYPVRASGHPYYLATCPAMLDDAIRLCNLLDEAELAKTLADVMELAVNKLYGSVQKDWVEEWVITGENDSTNAATTLLDKIAPEEKHLVILSDDRMGKLLESLPVVARNKLENGISQNLWYEEFVPRRSFFLTAIFAECNNDNEAIKEVLCGDGKSVRTIQIGANATVGYGVCRFAKL